MKLKDNTPRNRKLAASALCAFRGCKDQIQNSTVRFFRFMAEKEWGFFMVEFDRQEQTLNIADVIIFKVPGL